jgi:hypothetical protein
MREAAYYIRAAGVLDAPATFSWEGSGSAFGPPEGTKLHALVHRLTVCGVATLAARMQEWILWRLHAGIDVQRFLNHVDAAEAWAIDYRYKEDDKLEGTIPDDTPTNSALGDAVWVLRLVTAYEHWRHPQSSADAVALAHIARHIMPPKAKRAFTAWLDWASKRILTLAPAPKPFLADPDEFPSEAAYHAAGRPYFGDPIPLEALDPDFDYKPEMRKVLLAEFLSRLDWKTNPFLRSPDEMKKLGFPGTPYQLE